MTIRDTSLDAYKSIKKELGKRQQQVLEVIHYYGEANNLMISKKLGIPINSITPRVNELRKMGMVIEAYKDKCPYTKRVSIYWRKR